MIEKGTNYQTEYFPEPMDATRIREIVGDVQLSKHSPRNEHHEAALNHVQEITATFDASTSPEAIQASERLEQIYKNRLNPNDHETNRTKFEDQEYYDWTYLIGAAVQDPDETNAVSPETLRNSQVERAMHWMSESIQGTAQQEADAVTQIEWAGRRMMTTPV